MDNEKQVCGVIKSPYDSRDYKIIPKNIFPTEFTTQTTEVKNQGFQSTCVAHALSTVIEYHHKRQQGRDDRFSTEFIYGVRELGYYIGDGMVIRDALKTIQKYGDTYERDFPGNNDCDMAMKNVLNRENELKDLAYPHRISAYIRLNSEQEMKTSLMEYGMIVASMNWYDDYKLVDDIFTYTNDKKFGRHCVVIYGWNEDGWLVQNSWGKTWGNKGRFIVPFTYKFNEVWGIVDDIVNDNIIRPKTNAIIALLNRSWSFIVSCFRKIFIKK